MFDIKKFLIESRSLITEDTYRRLTKVQVELENIEDEVRMDRDLDHTSKNELLGPIIDAQDKIDKVLNKWLQLGKRKR